MRQLNLGALLCVLFCVSSVASEAETLWFQDNRLTSQASDAGSASVCRSLWVAIERLRSAPQ
jgi:hypothetical protein